MNGLANLYFSIDVLNHVLIFFFLVAEKLLSQVTELINTNEINLHKLENLVLFFINTCVIFSTLISPSDLFCRIILIN